MKVCAVICEYNPFHNGHKLHIDKIKERYDKVLCIMSGNFTQRAEPAIFDEYERAKLAIQNGADAVFRLPVQFSTACAEKFAMGAINILRNFNIDAISFGMENPNIDICLLIAKIQESCGYSNKLKLFLDQGNSYPSACVKSVCSLAKNKEKEVETFYSNPNNMLALEYVKAINKFELNWEIFPILRQGDYNSDTLSCSFASASAIRKAILNNIDCTTHLPYDYSIKDYKIANYTTFETILLHHLKTSTPNNFANCPSCAEGLQFKLIENAKKSSTLSECLNATKSKRYTLSRIKRLALESLLSITNSDLDLPQNAYTQLLAVKKDFISDLSNLGYYFTTAKELETSPTPEYFNLETNANLIYSTITGSPFSGIIKKLIVL